MFAMSPEKQRRHLYGMLAATEEFRGYLQEAMSPHELRQEPQDLQFRQPGREERADVFCRGLRVQGTLGT
jgi:hypothetical protein